jgi:hypothetical protein
VRLALFVTCFNDTLFPLMRIATAHLLERLGHRSHAPRRRRAWAFVQAALAVSQLRRTTGNTTTIIGSTRTNAVSDVPEQYPSRTRRVSTVWSP